MNTYTFWNRGLRQGIRRAAVTAACMGVAVCSTQAAVVFQADFNGDGTGTGGPNDVVTVGGTGTIQNTFDPAVAGGVTPDAPTLGGGSYLHTAVPIETGTAGGGILAQFDPTSADTSLASFTSMSGGQLLLNGGLDFFARVNSVVEESSAFRPFDASNFTGGTLDFQMRNQDSSLVAIVDARSANGLGAGNDPFVFAGAPFVFSHVGEIMHIGVTFASNATTGDITMTLFARADGGAIDTTSMADALGSVTFNVNEAEITEGFPAAQYYFGDTDRRSGDPKSIDFDLFRIYDSPPTQFAAIPEPASLVLAGASLLMLAGCRRSR